MTHLYLGVDAGNSKTLAVVCDERGVVRGWGRAGIGDIYGAPDEATAVDNVLRATRAALDAVSSGGQLNPPVVSAAFCLAGADWPEDHTFWRDLLAERLPSLPRMSVRNDGFATLRAGAPQGTGVAVAVGTGPAVVARGPQGTERCLGWWCFDPLGGAALVDGALRAVFLAFQGLGPQTALTERLIDLYAVHDVPELRHATSRRTNRLDAHDRTGAAREVLNVAQGGDGTAKALVVTQARALAGYASWVAAEAGFDVDTQEIPVVLGGSVVTSDVPILREALIDELVLRMPHAVPRVIDIAPVFGAVIEAAAEHGDNRFAALLNPAALPATAVSTD